jgi:hypothetical protein
MTLMTAQDRETGPAGIAAGEHSTAACPSWCEVDDHDDWDDGQMRHSAWTSVELSAYPFEATTGAPGAQETTLEHSALMVSRNQIRDHEQAIVICLPDSDGDLSDPDGHISLRDGQVLLTFAEAQETAISLLLMSGPVPGSLHLGCEPGDPSPCCPDSPLRASAYPAAVFCPGCGSLYSRR